MKKLLFPLLLLLFVFASACPSMAVLKPVLLEVTGYLEEYDTSVSPSRIVLKVDDKTASGPLSDWCEFIDERGTRIEKKVFFEKYMERMVTVNIQEETGEIVLCRVGS